jgi:hypothetical protein
VVGGVLAEPKRAAFERLRRAWRARNLAAFDAAMRSLAAQLAAAATDRESIAAQGSTERAMNALARRLDQAVRENTDRLIALHGLSGRAREGVLARLAGQFEVDKPVSVAASGAVGGLVSGALGGLAADLAAGGLTLGAGALVGGILGALGVGGAARAYNLARGAGEGQVRWSAEFLAQRFAAAILRYLAVAHYGRGRGDWVEDEDPAHWRALVAEIAARYRHELEPIWNAESRTSTDEVQRALMPHVSRATRDVLERLYPEARDLFA